MLGPKFNTRILDQMPRGSADLSFGPDCPADEAFDTLESEKFAPLGPFVVFLLFSSRHSGAKRAERSERGAAW